MEQPPSLASSGLVVVVCAEDAAPKKIQETQERREWRFGQLLLLSQRGFAKLIWQMWRSLKKILDKKEGRPSKSLSEIYSGPPPPKSKNLAHLF